MLEQAARRKRETTYPELLAARQCRLVVFGVEVGGRWNGEARELLRALARAKARERPQWLRASAAQAFHQRWSGIIAVAAQRALAATLAGLPGAGLDALAGTAPPWPEVLAAARLGEAEEASRCGPADGPRAVAARRRGRLLRPCRRKRFTLLARKTKCLTLAARKKVRKTNNEVYSWVFLVSLPVQGPGLWLQFLERDSSRSKFKEMTRQSFRIDRGFLAYLCFKPPLQLGKHFEQFLKLKQLVLDELSPRCNGSTGMAVPSGAACCTDNISDGMILFICVFRKSMAKTSWIRLPIPHLHVFYVFQDHDASHACTPS